MDIKTLLGRYAAAVNGMSLKLRAAAVLAVPFVLASLALLAPSAHADFQARFERELHAKYRVIPRKARRQVNRFHYVFVSGIYNEILPGYFAENRDSLEQEMGAKTISVIHPPT